MSRLFADRLYLFPTEIGTITVRGELVTEFDVEDIIRSRAISQARALQFVNIGKIIDVNAQLPNQAIPSAFVGNDETLQEG